MMPLHVTALITSVVMFSQNGSAMLPTGVPDRAHHLQVPTNRSSKHSTAEFYPDKHTLCTGHSQKFIYILHQNYQQ